MNKCKSCSTSTCPFAYTEESEQVQNYGCLPTPLEIMYMRVESGKTWACHSDYNRPCVGAINQLRKYGLPYKVIDKQLVNEDDDWTQYSKPSIETKKQINEAYRAYNRRLFEFGNTELRLNMNNMTKDEITKIAYEAYYNSNGISTLSFDKYASCVDEICENLSEINIDVLEVEYVCDNVLTFNLTFGDGYHSILNLPVGNLVSNVYIATYSINKNGTPIDIGSAYLSKYVEIIKKL